MDEGSGTNTSTVLPLECDVFQGLEYTIVSGIRVFTALLSLLCCLGVIVLIFVFKRHHYFIQRLVLYVCIITAINSGTIMLQKVDYFTPNSYQEDILDKYCIFIGFCEYYTSMVQLTSLICVTHGLYHCIIKQKPKKYLEVSYITISILAPLLIACVPFFGPGTSYGKSGPWCWIKDRNEECNKNYFGISLQYILWYFPVIAVTILILLVYVCMVSRVRQRLENHWQGPYDPELFLHKGKLKKVVKMMLAYLPIGFILVNLFSLPNTIHWTIADSPILVLWLIHGVIPPLRGTLFAIPYLFHTDTRRQIKQMKIKATIKEYFTRKSTVSNYPAKQCNFSDSLTFPVEADTTYERHRPYRNLSLLTSQKAPPTKDPLTGPVHIESEDIS